MKKMNILNIFVVGILILAFAGVGFSYSDNYDIVYLKNGFLVQKLPSSQYSTWLKYVYYPSDINISDTYLTRFHTDITLHNETKTIEQYFNRANLGIVLVKVKPNTINDRQANVTISCVKYPYDMTKENTTDWQDTIYINSTDYDNDGFVYVEINPYHSKTMTRNGEMAFWCSFKTNMTTHFEIDEFYLYDSSFWHRIVGTKPFCDYENKYIVANDEVQDFCNKQVSLSSFTKFNKIFTQFQEILLIIFVDMFKIGSVIALLFTFVLLPIWLLMKVKQYIDKTFRKKR